MATIQQQNFGIEIEVTGVARHIIAEAVAEAVEGRVTATNCDGYDTTIITDPQGREWKVKNDGSIPILRGHRGSEIVTPILTYPDIPLLQDVVRKVRGTGASAPENSCSVHCHVSAEAHTPQTLTNLAKMFYKNEDLIFDAFRVHPDRRARYCRPMDYEFIQKIAKRRPRTDRQLNEAWFGHYNPNPQHYDQSRYRSLNLVAKWRINTIEFRFHNGCLHSGRIKAFVQLCLAMSAKALNAHAASHRKIPTDNPKFNFRVWLVATLGMKGDEFKTARYHLTRYLPGNSAWRHGQPSNRKEQSGRPSL